jgi:hypothetical protein
MFCGKKSVLLSHPSVLLLKYRHFTNNLSVGWTHRQLGRPSRSSVDARTLATSKHPGHLVLRRQFAARLCTVSASGRVTKIAIDKRAREGENKGHEESLAGVLPASDRLHGEEAAGCSDPASNTEPAATANCRTHRTLCSRKTGKCQHGDLQLSARDHRDRFKNGAHQASLQENERGKMRLGLEGASLHHRAQAAPSFIE